MEEKKIDKLYMLAEVLNERFDKEQWKKIAMIKPAIFLKLQSKIKARLMNNEKMYNTHF